MAGALSPEPTVVIVTADHQKPALIPFTALPPNCSGFRFRSSSHARKRMTSRISARPSMNRKNGGEKNSYTAFCQFFFPWEETAMLRPVV